MTVQQIPINPLYKKDNGMFVVDMHSLPFPKEFSFSEQVAIVIPATVVAGNHKHTRVEAFVSLSESLEVFWQEADGTVRSLPMMKKDQLFLTIIPSLLPHAVKNNDVNHAAFLIEFSNQISGPVERIELVTP